MRVLIVFTANDTHNPFVRELKDGLEHAGCTVSWNLKDFWDKKGNYDIIHIQWPEYLFPQDFDERSFDELQSVLNFWKKRSSIILTRHNKHPYYTNRPALYQELYHLVYSYCDGIVHLGSDGLEAFKSAYPSDLYGNAIRHTIIPHHIYLKSYPNNISQKEARDLLNISNKAFVVLVFGRIRLPKERRFLVEIFKRQRKEETLFILPSWLPLDLYTGNTIKDNLKRRYYRLKIWLINRNKNIVAAGRFINDKDVQLYFNAADILLIPRIDGLNSGNVTLGYFFKKVVIGPHIG
ncbi:MAG: hypothetical protein ACRDE2_14955, partial [Chitinophagaceae bacterium]